MSIPDGAVTRGHCQTVELAVLGEDSPRPALPPGSTLLSAIIVCGPREIELEKPMILQFDHCAELKAGNWEVSLWMAELELLEARSSSESVTYSSNHSSPTTTLSRSSKWRKLQTLGAAEVSDCNGRAFAQLDHSEVFLVTEMPGAYVIAGENSMVAPGLAVKRLGVEVYVSRERDHVRCYVLEDIKSAHRLIADQVR